MIRVDYLVSDSWWLCCCVSSTHVWLMEVHRPWSFHINISKKWESWYLVIAPTTVQQRDITLDVIIRDYRWGNGLLRRLHTISQAGISLQRQVRVNRMYMSRSTKLEVSWISWTSSESGKNPIFGNLACFLPQRWSGTMPSHRTHKNSIFLKRKSQRLSLVNPVCCTSEWKIPRTAAYQNGCAPTSVSGDRTMMKGCVLRFTVSKSQHTCS